MLSEWLLVVLGIVLTAGTAVFVAAEFSLVALDPSTVDRLASQDRRLTTVKKALHHLSTNLSGAQVGITATTVLLGYTTQPALVSLLGRLFDDADWVGPAASAAAVVIALICVNTFSMMFGELVPKNMALSDPLKTAKLVAPLQHGFTVALRPLIAVLNGSANAILGLFGVEATEELSGARSAPELTALVRRSAEAGTLDQDTATLLTRSIGLRDLTAVDVMTDRTRLQVLPRTASAADVVAAAIESGHSRFPVIEDDVDDIVGIVTIRKAVAVPYERRGEVPVSALMFEAPRVPETVSLGPLLVDLRASGPQVAIVVDEYGGTSGLVTLEDVVEELVGDVADEHDPKPDALIRLGPGSFSVPGVWRPDELRAATGIVTPEDAAYETLGGLVMAQLGRIPKPGDAVAVAHARLRVAQMDGRRVERLVVQDAPRGEEEL